MTDEDAPVARRVAASAGWQGAAKIAVAGIGVASVAVLTRYLGTESYGAYALGFSYLALFGAVADLGLFSILVREISREPERAGELVGNGIALRAVLWLVVSIVAVGISLVLPYEPEVHVAIALAALPFGLGLINGAVLAGLQARLSMAGASGAEVAGRAVTFGAAVAVAALDLGFAAVMLTAALGAAVTLALTTLAARGAFALRPRMDLAVWRMLLFASIPLGLALGINELYFRADQLIISLSRPLEEVGWYGLAFRVVEITATLPGTLLVSLFPVMAVQVARRDPQLRATMQTGFDILVAVGAPLALGGLVLAGPVVVAVAGEDFADAADPLSILLFAAALMFVNGLLGYALIARDRQRDTLWLNVAALTCNLALNVALVPEYGIEAAAATAVVSELLILGGALWLVHRHLGILPGPGMLFRAVAAAAAMTGVLWLCDAAPLLVLLAIAAVTYPLALWAVGGIRREQLDALRRR
ncbi:MAG: flippase [Solirubrobacteraceae bacterium]|nr:flippase [Solirubrobacteraceae bacterium]